MRKRRYQYHFYLDEKESQFLDAAVKRSGLTCSAYIRTLIKNLIPADRPPPDYLAMMRELHAIGNNLNQIAQKAHMTGVIDASRYDTKVTALAQAIAKINKEVKEPRRA
jgi:hypothetical protein